MGRPIRKNHMGALTQSGFQLSVNAKFETGAAEPAYIVSQRGTRKYKCKNIAGTKELDCFLIDGTGIAGVPTVVGTACMPVLTSAGTEYARTLYQYTVKTYAGNTYAWDADGRGTVVVGLGDGGIVDVPVVLETAVILPYIMTGAAAPQVIPVSDGGSGYSVGTFNATVTGGQGTIQPVVTYTVSVANGPVASVSLTNKNLPSGNVNGDELTITIPAPV